MVQDHLKTCLICKQSLKAECFYPFSKSRDGLYPYCRPCERNRKLKKRIEKDDELAKKYSDRKAEFEAVIPGEEWKDCVGWEGWYQVSSYGRVRSLPRKVEAPNRWGECKREYPGVLLRQRERAFGHMAVGLRKAGKAKLALVHRLVCEAFNGPCPKDKYHCAHKDGKPGNNRADNLYWATAQENSEDARRHGTLRVGEKSNLSRLTEADVIEIRRRASAGESSYRIAKDIGMTANGVRKIVIRENWKHI